MENWNQETSSLEGALQIISRLNRPAKTAGFRVGGGRLELTVLHWVNLVAVLLKKCEL